MKSYKLGIIFLVLIALGGVIYYQKAKVATEDPVVGCYVARLGKDVYSLNISSQKGGEVEGTLVFKNFEKDSSSGPFWGVFDDGILLGYYSFRSEGTDSVIQVIFKKSGADFIRGYGPVDETGAQFADLKNITYDTNVVFKQTTEPCATSLP